jgi:hypothetical protein
LEFEPRHGQYLGAGASHRDYLELFTRVIDGRQKIQDDLAALDPKQMLPRALACAFEGTDDKNVDMSGDHLKDVSMMVEKFGVTSIKQYAVRRLNGSVPCGVTLEYGLVHSWATSFA